jgi:hypothetical protein
VGDIHGTYAPFVTILKGTGVVDADLHWAAGRDHFVQMGDIVDRGDEARKIFDLIKALEAEAEAAGGRVHMLIGNHEESNILGLSFDISGGVTVAQFLSFLPERYKAAKEREFRAETGTGAGAEGGLAPFWSRLMDDPEARALYTGSFNERYGRWIARHPAFVKINGIGFVHGGLSESFSTYPCEKLNALLSGELLRWIRGVRDFPPRVLRNSRGPLWYRDLAMGDESILEAELDRILKNAGIRALVVAHTPSSFSVSLADLNRFGDKVWTIDTGIWMETGGALSALIVEDGSFKIWTEQGFLEPRERKEIRGGR